MQNNRRVLIWLFVLVSLYLGADAMRENIPYGIRINTSDSLPYKVFISKPADGVHRGDYVAFQHPLKSMKLVKKVVGLPGDHLERAGDFLFCEGFNCGQVKLVSPSGRLITPVSEQVVPEGCVFVHGTHPDSFDSRYEEFGFVRIENLKEQLWPLF